MGLFRSAPTQGQDSRIPPVAEPEEVREEPVPPVRSERTPAPRPSGRDTVLAQGQVFEGNLRGEGAVRLDGTFRGDISLQGVVSISMTGELVGTIEATNVLVSGSVEGDITAHGKLRLTCGSRVRGDIKSQSLSVEDGASFDGHSTMLSDKSAPLPASPGAALPPLEELQFGRNYSVDTEEEAPEEGEAPEVGAPSE